MYIVFKASFFVKVLLGSYRVHQGLILGLNLERIYLLDLFQSCFPTCVDQVLDRWRATEHLGFCYTAEVFKLLESSQKCFKIIKGYEIISSFKQHHEGTSSK